MRCKLFYVLLLAVLLSSCGYSIRKAPAISTVRLGTIENKTTEPKLSDWLYDSLSVELLKNGIKLNGRSPHELSGSIDRVSFYSKAQKAGITVQYSVEISGRFYMEGPDGQKKRITGRNVFIIAFGSGGSIGDLDYQKETALKKVIDSISEDIAASVYAFK